ncbi:MAG: serine/threonine protein kinase [Solirubrobacterales bacterium]|nr:serine/threonine protein kinase [Solirubrobacterales bacterium]
MIGTVLSDRYRLESKLGSGGMSTVYLAIDETLDRPVAIKVLHREMSDEADQLARFRQEARSAARLSHPNLVGVIDAGDDQGRPYIVFEYVDGETLKQRLSREGPLPIDEAVAYAIEVGRGLVAAHKRKLVHRDVKPQNVLIDSDGSAKITDFGIARSLETKGMTVTGRVLGTTDYVSPEQAMGEEVDARSDVYSLGIVLYEMLTGDVPYEAETQVAVAMKHVNDPMPDVFELRPDCSAAVAAVVDRATAKDQEYRYRSVGEMVSDLEATLEVEAARAGGTSGEATTVLRSVPRRRRSLAGPNRVSRAGIVMGLIGIALIAAALIIGSSGKLPDIGGNGSTGGGSEIKLSNAVDFDPEGDGEEHSDELSLPIDGNPTGTAWSTETYTDESMSGKRGVGIYVNAGTPVTAEAVQVRSAVGGWDAEVRSAPGDDSAPQALDGWTVVGAATDVGTRETIPIDDPQPSRFYLVWITKPAEADDGSGFRVEIDDIRLLGKS